MPADIRGGPSRTHRLPNQAEAEAAEQALLAKVPPPSRRPLAPPPPLPPELQDAPPTPYTQAMQRAATGTLQTGSPVGQALYGQPAEPAEPEWRREQRERIEAFAGPAAVKRRTNPTATEPAEVIDAAPRLLG